MKAAGKEVPPTPVIPNSDDEEKESDEDEEGDEIKCVDLTEGMMKSMTKLLQVLSQQH